MTRWESQVNRQSKGVQYGPHNLPPHLDREERERLESIYHSIGLAAKQSKLDLGKYDDEVEISCKVKGDGKHSILKLLAMCQSTGAMGHSHSIVFDPDSSDYRQSVGWDGDGADSINDIKVDGKKLSREDEKDLTKKSFAYRLGVLAASDEG
jgi:hypothetical protein